MPNQITLRTFAYRHEAEPLRSFLEAYGVEAFVSSDDGGAWDPALGFTRDVRLAVWKRDAARAEKLLATVEGQTNGSA
jgi:hypothetical protein